MVTSYEFNPRCPCCLASNAAAGATRLVLRKQEVKGATFEVKNSRAGQSLFGARMRMGRQERALHTPTPSPGLVCRAGLGAVLGRSVFCSQCLFGPWRGVALGMDSARPAGRRSHFAAPWWSQGSSSPGSGALTAAPMGSPNAGGVALTVSLPSTVCSPAPPSTCTYTFPGPCLGEVAEIANQVLRSSCANSSWSDNLPSRCWSPRPPVLSAFPLPPLGLALCSGKLLSALP